MVYRSLRRHRRPINRSVSPGSAARRTGVALGVAASPTRPQTRCRRSKQTSSETSVSGLSSGAYMAGQFQVAFSRTRDRRGNRRRWPLRLRRGLGRLRAPTLHGHGPRRPRSVQAPCSAPEDAAKPRSRDRPAGRIWWTTTSYIFSGTGDGTVKPPVVATVADFYRPAGVPAEQIEFVADLPAGTRCVTEDSGNACSVTGPPFVNDCDYDQADRAPRADLWRELRATDDSWPAGCIEFDQIEFLPDPTAHGMATDRLRLRPARLRGRWLQGTRRLPRLPADQWRWSSDLRAPHGPASTAGPSQRPDRALPRRPTRPVRTRTPAGTGGATTMPAYATIAAARWRRSAHGSIGWPVTGPPPQVCARSRPRTSDTGRPDGPGLRLVVRRWSAQANGTGCRPARRRSSSIRRAPARRCSLRRPAGRGDRST